MHVQDSNNSYISSDVPSIFESTGSFESWQQVSLAIPGGYVPELFEIREYQNHHFMLKLG